MKIPVGWSHDTGSKNQAPYSWKGDYVVSHRNGLHIVSHRPRGEHNHVGEFKTAEEAFQAADSHAKSSQHDEHPATYLDFLKAGGRPGEYRE